MHKFGEVILTQVQFVDKAEIKIRPALVLFQERGNIVLAGMTSNEEMQGIPITKKEGAIKDSVIKLNYLFTISEFMVKKKLFEISEQKKRIIKEEIFKRLRN